MVLDDVRDGNCIVHAKCVIHMTLLKNGCENLA